MENEENEENTEIDENGTKSPPDDFEVWKGISTSNRGHVLGAGFTTDPAFVLTGIMGSGSIYATQTCSPYEVYLFSLFSHRFIVCHRDVLYNNV